MWANWIASYENPIFILDDQRTATVRNPFYTSLTVQLQIGEIHRWQQEYSQ